MDDKKAPPAYTEVTPEPKGDLAHTDTNNESLVGEPIKTYQVVSQSALSNRHFEIQHNGRTVYWVNTKHPYFRSPIVHIATGSREGTIVASCKLQTWSRKLKYYLGNPDCTDPDTWPIADCEGWTEKAFSFSVGGRMYSWRRTRNKELGASRWSSKSFKLVDSATGKIIAVHIFTQSLFGGKLKKIARIEFFEELGRELELTSLAVVHGIEERIREAERSSAVSGGGGGGGG